MNTNLRGNNQQPPRATDTALDQANIENLTALWRAMGATASDDALPGLHASPGWPHRFWFDGLRAPKVTPQVHNALANLPARAMVPVWRASGADSELEQILRQLGYSVALEQRAMHLTQWQDLPPDSLTLHPVASGNEQKLWTQLCSDAFGYPIDGAVIAHLARDDRARLWLAEQDGEAVATALLFRTGGTVGVHQVGVPAAYRGRGVARAMMQALMHQCQVPDTESLVLQASAAGEGLYRQLGFQPRFLLRSYQRQ